MLRASLRSSRSLTRGAAAGHVRRQWLAVARPGHAVYVTNRTYADDAKKASIGDSRPIVLPGSASAANSEPLPPGAVKTSPSSAVPVPPVSSTIPADSMPKMPPAPPPASSTTTSAVPSPASPPPPPPPKPRKLFRTFLLSLVVLSALGFGGGVYYSRVSDRFHDFFTEYVPFGEEAVLYFEEKEFRKRFPSFASQQQQQRSRDSGSQVTIPGNSGVSWKVSEENKRNGSHVNATGAVGGEAKPGEAMQTPQESHAAEKVKAVKLAKNETAKSPSSSSSSSSDGSKKKKASPAPATTGEAKKTTAEPVAAKSETKAAEPAAKPSGPGDAAAAAKQPSSAETVSNFREPEVNEPSRFPPENILVEPVRVRRGSSSNSSSPAAADADEEDEPLMEDLAALLNGIIAAANADQTSAAKNPRFSSTLNRAKDELAGIAGKIRGLRAAAAREADGRISATHDDFDRAARELVRRLEGQVAEQEARWKDEYETERQRLHETYESRLHSEIEQARRLNEQRLHNELLEQAVELKRGFAADVRSRVEEERGARLGRLEGLTRELTDLEKLAAGWAGVVEQNLKTQHLHVAVEAVRATLEQDGAPSASGPPRAGASPTAAATAAPRPFTRELAALKEIAAADPLVDAAIASINPAAYQCGVPSGAQLVDRFRRVAAEVRKAALLPAGAGVASHASSYVLSKLLFRRQGLVAGDDVESILTRTETYLEEGDLDGAAREMNGLTGWAKTLSGDWLGEVRKVLEVQQALEVIATEARLQSLLVE